MIKHNSAIPLYQQISKIIEKNIKNNIYPAGEKLPSENDFCKEHSVSRITVRQALKILEQKNLIYSVHGKGNFVSSPSIDQSLLKISSFEKTLEEIGMKGSSKIISFKIDNFPEINKNFFNKSSNTKFSFLSLIGYGNNIPFVYYESYFEKKIGEQFYKIALEFEKEKKAFSTYDIIKETEINIFKMEQRLSAINSDEKLSQILKIPLNTALMKIETFLYEENNKILEYKLAYYRSDKYSFCIKRELN